MAIDYTVLALPKGPTRKQLRAKQARALAKQVTAVREAVVYNAKQCCSGCGVYVGHYGHAHHVRPRSLGGKWTAENMKYLCATCHARAHRLRVK